MDSGSDTEHDFEDDLDLEAQKSWLHIFNELQIYIMFNDTLRLYKNGGNNI